jgi:hypothetical protein
MRFFRLIAGTTLTVFLLGAGVASADPPWSVPAPIVSGMQLDFPPVLTFSGDGHALATLDGGNGGQLSPLLVANPGGSTFTEIGRVLLLAPPAPYGRRGFAYLRAPSPPPGPHPIDNVKLTRLGVSLGTVPGSLGRFQLLARLRSRPGDQSASIGADPRGNVAAAWAELQDKGRRRPLRVALRRPGHAFGRPRTLVGRPVVRNIALAYGTNGDLVVAFERLHAFTEAGADIAVRVKRHGGRFGPIQSLGPSRGSSSIATAVGPTGTAVVAWGTQDGGEEAGRPWTVRAAMLRSAAPRFSKTQLLDPGRVDRPASRVGAAIGGDGTTTVAWTGVAARKLPYPLRVAMAGRTGRFGPTAQLAPNGAMLGVVAARDGTTTVLWGSLSAAEDETLGGIFASRRPAGAGAFTASEAVSPPESASNHASIALDPLRGSPAVLWIGSPGTPSGGLPQSPVQPLYSTRGA